MFKVYFLCFTSPDDVYNMYIMYKSISVFRSHALAVTVWENAFLAKWYKCIAPAMSDSSGIFCCCSLTFSFDRKYGLDSPTCRSGRTSKGSWNWMIAQSSLDLSLVGKNLGISGTTCRCCVVQSLVMYSRSVHPPSGNWTQQGLLYESRAVSYLTSAPSSLTAAASQSAYRQPYVLHLTSTLQTTPSPTCCSKEKWTAILFSLKSK